MEKIPTAEEFLEAYQEDLLLGRIVLHKAMIEFAKMHVEAALKEASKKVKLTDFADEFLQEGAVDAINKDSILNSYPLENIK